MDPFTIGLALAGTALTAFGKKSSSDAQARADFDAGQQSIAESKQSIAAANITIAEAGQSITSGKITLNMASLYGLNAETAKSNVGLLETQAEIAGTGEDFAFAKARLQKGRIAEQGRVTLAAQRTEFSSRNIDPAFGSPLLTQALTASRVAQDIDLTDAGAAVEAADARTRKAGILAQAAGAQGAVVTSIGQKLSAELTAQSQFDRAGTQYDRANSQFDLAGSQVTRARSLFSRASADADAGWIGAASALLSGGAAISGKFGTGGGNVGTMDVGGNSYVAFQ